MIKQVLVDILWLLLMYVCMWLALEFVVWVIPWQPSAMPDIRERAVLCLSAGIIGVKLFHIAVERSRQ